MRTFKTKKKNYENTSLQIITRFFFYQTVMVHDVLENEFSH